MELHILLLLLAGLLIVVSLVQRLAARLAVSASVVLAVVGIALGSLSAFVLYAGPGSAVSGLARLFFDLPISSEAFLYIFLPILLFQSALEIEVKQIVEDAGPILVLAVVAVLVATFVIGLALAPIAGVPLVACLLLGAIVATTDPVAVIGIFRDVGAPSRLTRLVAGESLLNDAAAITLFAVLLDILVGAHRTGTGAAMLTFIWEFLGGVVVGYAGARVVVGLLSWLPDLRLAQVTLTLALPYLVFIIGERGLGVSGVVAAVTAGLVTSALGPPRMSPSDWHFLHELWEQLAFWASSLIFILASLLVPRLLLDVGWHDALLLAVLVIAALAARALVLFILLPALSALHLSQRIDHRFKLVILWGGLRGAVTLALALAVTENHAIGHDVQRFIAVLATGFVLFTLIVGGTTLRPLIRMLRLDRLSPLDQALRAQVWALAQERVLNAVRQIGGRYGFPGELVGAVADTYAPKAAGPAGAGGRLERPASTDITDADRLRLGLVALANREREVVLEHFSARTVSGRIVEELLADVGRLVDRSHANGRDGYLEAAQHLVGFSRGFQIAHFLHRRFRADEPLVDRLADRFERLLVNRIVLDELAPYADEKLAPLVGERVCAEVRDVLLQRDAMTRAALSALSAQYPSYAALLERRFLERVALRREDLEYRTLFEERVIGPELYGVLRRGLEVARAALASRPRLDLGLETRTLIAKVPMFGALTAAQLDAVAHLLRPRFAVPGERLISTGERGDAMYFLSSGTVLVDVAGRSIPLTAGDFFGEMALVLEQPRQADVTAISYCQLLVLQARDFQALLRSRREIKARIDEAAEARLRMNEQAGQAVSPGGTGSDV